GVGGEALVEHAQRGGETLVLEIGVEHRQVDRHHQALVGEDPGGKARNVKGGIVCFERLLGAAPGDVKAAFRRVVVEGVGDVDEDLADPRQTSQRLGSAYIRLDRYLPPSRYDEALGGQFRLQLPLGCRR